MSENERMLIIRLSKVLLPNLWSTYDWSAERKLVFVLRGTLFDDFYSLEALTDDECSYLLSLESDTPYAKIIRKAFRIKHDSDERPNPYVPTKFGQS